MMAEPLFGLVFDVAMCGRHQNKGKNSPGSCVLSKGGGSKVVRGQNGGNAPLTCVLSEGGSKGVVLSVVNDPKHK